MSNIGNYCALFVDLLGQREEYRGAGLVPIVPEQRTAFLQELRATIGRTREMQEASELLMSGISKKLLKGETGQHKWLWEEVQKAEPRRQRWSDGLVYFVGFGADVRLPATGAFKLLVLAGSLCFLGLAWAWPVRGSIDLAWGVELHENEIYGGVVANCYELESTVAVFPRIVVGERAVQYLKERRDLAGQDELSELDRRMAAMCLELLDQDVDGHCFVDYLGEGFRRYVPKAGDPALYRKALGFLEGQLATYRSQKNTKLAFRYTHVMSYFAAHPVSDKRKMDG